MLIELLVIHSNIWNHLIVYKSMNSVKIELQAILETI